MLVLGSSPLLADFAGSCLEILLEDSAAPDGEYFIEPTEGRQFAVWCHDMAGSTPSEYLTLPNTGGGFNFSQYTAGGAAPGTDVATHYSRVRLDPVALTVDMGDQTFATSTGSLSHGPTPVTSMPYGVAMACVSNFNPAGTANIDLTGTPFAVADPFATDGYNAAGSVTFSSIDQVVDLTGGGFCGFTTPAPILLKPQLGGGAFAWTCGTSPRPRRLLLGSTSRMP